MEGKSKINADAHSTFNIPNVNARIDTSKTCLPQMRQHCSPGIFVRKNPTSATKTQQVIGSCCVSDRSMPQCMICMLIRSQNNKDKVILVVE